MRSDTCTVTRAPTLCYQRTKPCWFPPHESSCLSANLPSFWPLHLSNPGRVNAAMGCPALPLLPQYHSKSCYKLKKAKALDQILTGTWNFTSQDTGLQISSWWMFCSLLFGTSQQEHVYPHGLSAIVLVLIPGAELEAECSRVSCVPSMFSLFSACFFSVLVLEGSMGNRGK